MGTWVAGWQRGLEERAGPVLLALALFVSGVILGALAVGALGEADKHELAAAVSAHFGTLAAGRPLAGTAALHRVLGEHLRTAAVFWLLGLTVAGSLGAMGLLVLRGFASGFAAAFLGASMGWRGVLWSAAALLPHGIVAVPALVLMAGGTAHFALAVVRGPARQTRSGWRRHFGQYSGWMARCALLLLAAALIEAYVTPLIMRWSAGLP